MIELERVPEAEEVVRFRLARDVRVLKPYHTGAYWVDGLLIDTGCAHTAPALLGLLKGWRVAQVANTHSHEDHIGANAEVQAEFGCPIHAHPQALPILENPRLQPLQPYRRLFWGRPKPSRGEALGDRLETDHLRFQVIPTPGHSPDSVSLFEAERGWLFCGDAYVGGKDRAIREGYDVLGIIASLKHMAELPVRVIFSGSGSVRAEGVQPLRDKIDHLEELGERIRSLSRQGMSPRKIRRTVLGREMSIAYITLGHFSGMQMVRSYLAKEGAGPETGASS